MTHSLKKATEVYWSNSLANNPVKRLLWALPGELPSSFATHLY